MRSQKLKSRGKNRRKRGGSTPRHENSPNMNGVKNVKMMELATELGISDMNNYLFKVQNIEQPNASDLIKFVVDYANVNKQKELTKLRFVCFDVMHRLKPSFKGHPKTYFSTKADSNAEVKINQRLEEMVVNFVENVKNAEPNDIFDILEEFMVQTMPSSQHTSIATNNPIHTNTFHNYNGNEPSNEKNPNSPFANHSSGGPSKHSKSVRLLRNGIGRMINPLSKSLSRAYTYGTYLVRKKNDTSRKYRFK